MTEDDLGPRVVRMASAPPEPRSVSCTLSALADHSRGRRLAARSRRIFIHNLQVSILVASWTVLLSVPVIIWPLGEWIWDVGCHGLQSAECMAHKSCLWQRTFSWDGSCVARQSGYLSLWGTMLLQFFYSVYRDYGSTVKFTVQGAVGTLLAWANMAFLNRVLGFWLGGGAFRDAIPVVGRPDLVNSGWLPLCNDGVHTLSDTGDFCLLNVWWRELGWSGIAKTCFVWFDFVVFVMSCLAVGFDTNTRMFALSTHVYFMMSFVDPSKADFDQSSPISWNYACMVMFASCVAIVCFCFPRRRFTALKAADALAAEAGQAVGLIVESLQAVTTELMRQKATSALAETRVVLADLEAKLEASWFEDFGWGSTAWKRRRLRRFASCLHASIRHAPSVYHVAGALRPSDVQTLDDHLPPLREACAATRDLLELDADRSHAELDIVVEECMDHAAASFSELRPRLSAEARAFLFTVYGAISDARRAAEQFSNWESDPVGTRSAEVGHVGRCLRVFRTVRRRFGIELFGTRFDSFRGTHARFVLRNTFTISVAFAIGWGGLWNVLPAYSYYPSSTISVVVYTYTGSSAPVTVKRVAGVVLGKVLGTIIQLSACQSWWRASLFGGAMFCVVCAMFFLYLQMDRDMAYVCCLTGAFAASSMIPGNFQLRDCKSNILSDVAPTLLNAIISTVIGVGILTVVDLLFASRAANQARQRLLRAILGAKALFASACSGTNAVEAEAKLRVDLDALRDLLPYAAAEPTYWRPPFKLDLYETLQTQLRTLGVHLGSMAWAMKLLETQCETQLLDSAAEDNFASVTCTGLSAPTSAARRGASRGWSPVLKEAAFRPLLRRIKDELRIMLDDVEQLAVSVTSEHLKTSDEGATEASECGGGGVGDIRRQLEADLYTDRAVRLVAFGASNAVDSAKQGSLLLVRSSSEQQQRRRRSSSSSLDVGGQQQAAVTRSEAQAGGGEGGRAGPVSAFRRAARRLRSQVINERLGLETPLRAIQQFDDSPGGHDIDGDPDPFHMNHGSESGVESLEQIFERLRSEAGPRCGPWPHCDDSCRVELLISLVNSIMLEVRKMQLALLEY